MNDSHRFDRDEERMKVLNVLMAASLYDSACMFSCFVKRSSSLSGAHELAKIIKSFNGGKISEFHRIKLTEDYADNALICFEVFESAKQLYPFEKRVLESFCKYFAHAENKFKVWKFNTDYIIGIGLATLGYSLGKITNDQKNERISNVTSSGMCVFTYSPSLVLRSFAEMSAKFKEIEAKVTKRNSKNEIN